MHCVPRIIINADDFGISDEVNGEICALMERNLISSTTILANGPAFHEAARVARTCQQSVGIHLNHIEFRPILSDYQEPSKFFEHDGQFSRNFQYSVTLRDGRYVAAEWVAQVRAALDAGVPLSHMDSHGHVHTTPANFLAVKAVQRHGGVGRVRISRNIIPKALERGPRAATKLLKKAVWNTALRRIGPTATTTDLFGSVMDFVYKTREVSEDYWYGKTIELMCHPGLDDGPSREECEWLRAGLANVVGFNFDLITYNEI